MDWHIMDWNHSPCVSTLCLPLSYLASLHMIFQAFPLQICELEAIKCWVETEQYSVVYFDCIAAFKVL